jgi:hypothetical protein
MIAIINNCQYDNNLKKSFLRSITSSWSGLFFWDSIWRRVSLDIIQGFRVAGFQGFRAFGRFRVSGPSAVSGFQALRAFQGFRVSGPSAVSGFQGFRVVKF